MPLPITIIPTPSLRSVSAKISASELKTDTVQNFLQDMIPTMYFEEGIGLAAPQVAHNIRACIIGKKAIPPKAKIPGRTHPNRADLILINPSYQVIGRKQQTETEGCLSVPGFYGKVARSRDLLVTAQIETGETIEFEAHGFFARVIQHEIDHLNGILFIDRAKDLFQTEHRKYLAPEVVVSNVKHID